MNTINRVYPSTSPKRDTGSHCKSFRLRIGARRVVQIFSPFIVLLLVMVWGTSLADETNPPAPAAIVSPPDTNYLEILHTLAGLSDQLRSNQVAIEQNAKEAKEASVHGAELLSSAFQSMQQTFSSQQQALSDRNASELEAMQSSNRVVVMAGAIFAAVVAVTLFLIVYFQWRISKAWTDISHVLPISSGLGSGGAAALGRGGSEPAPAGLGSANARLLHAVEELETRVHGLEHNAGAATDPGGLRLSAPGNGESGSEHKHASTAAESGNVGGSAQTRISAWLGQGQSMLKQNDWQAALQCFDEVLTLDPNHGEALVKKGAALERMKKLSEAFECYDRAIAADESMTIAYLHKGGLCSRLERFKEALECYEKALRTHTDLGS